ncbi:MAG: 4-(cytidine 5'-diphospho)-2-C-methyl-D-erythritol kinase [Coriobacteriia bacterium]|nr:4-(cytidine 5'-diphospho)-2-C-methyl-D-erythritol kinase [Coriobacteriia bacterium]
MQLDSAAKVNLVLNVSPPDESGYHPVETIIHLLSFGDTITIEDAEWLSLSTSTDLGIAPERNLAYQAALKMGEVFGREVPYHIHIEKRIPHGGGLGGGSSNAATVLRALADLWEVAPDDERLLAIARDLGADVAAFLAPTPCTHLVGRGDVIKRSLPARTGIPLVLVKVPGVHASTAEVYRTFDRVGASVAHPPLVNDLADASIEVCPEVGKTLEWLRAQPQTDCAQVSGSGSVCFALVQSKEEAAELADAAQAQGFWSVATTLR